MTSPKVAASRNLVDQSRSSFGSINMDELLTNIYADAFPADDGGASGVGGSNKTVDEVWKEIVAGSGGGGGGGRSREEEDAEMTLEDFLTKAGAVTEDDVRIPAILQPSAAAAGYAADPIMSAAQFQPSLNGIEGGIVAVAAGSGGGDGGGGGGGRWKRRAVEGPPMDKATQQKQKRMIKNRESAARSRERKQAYTVELESLVTQLEEEKARLLSEEAKQSKERLKQLMETLIPVVEQKRPPRALRRVHSMCW